jgi:hypothetical protein
MKTNGICRATKQAGSMVWERRCTTLAVRSMLNLNPAMSAPAVDAPTRRYKPKSTVRDKMDPATAGDYERMAAACIEALIAGNTNVYFTFPYFLKFKSEGFPKGQIVEKTATSNLHKINAEKLLNWLYKHGFSRTDAKAVNEAKRVFGKKLTMLERSLGVDLDYYLCDNAVSQGES